MAALSQLVEFAKTYRPQPAPGVEVIVTPRYQVQLIPDFPIAGPNNVAWVRCQASEADDVIDEVNALVAARHLSVAWILDPDTRPPDFDVRLRAHGIVPDPGGEETAVMVLSVDANLGLPRVEGLVIRDALADLGSFTAAEQVAAEAFAGVPFGEDTGIDGLRERRLANTRAAGNRHTLLATLDGEPAGSASLAVFAPCGAMINGGAVRPRFRGRGVYRALVAARLRIAKAAGAAGLVVWGGHMSAPILAGLGFETVSWRRFYVPSGGQES